jgi:signal transduction histidine kinase
LPASRRAARVRPLPEQAQRAAFWVIRLRWPYRPGVLDTAWAVFSVVNLLAILRFESWETIPFHFIWISFTLLYGFRTWSARPTTIVLAIVMVTTAAGIGLDVIRGTEPKEELTEVPLMAAMFVAMVWHARRKLAAEHEYHRVSEQNARLLTNQRRFLQDASHQLRTPITIALGHAELLGSVVTGQQEGRDVEVILGELNRLRHISDRLLVIAAADDPEFLRLEPVALDRLTMEIIRRWRPTATRQWRLGQLDEVSVFADAERLELAVDALLENAVRHTGTGDVIKLSVVRGWAGEPVRMTVTDTGSGIPADRLDRIFERFSTGNDGTSRGTGLGLALVRAVARAHGGDVRVSSTVGEGSEFELLLPAVPTTPELPADGMPAAEVAGLPDDRMAEEQRGSITR